MRRSLLSMELVESPVRGASPGSVELMEFNVCWETPLSMELVECMVVRGALCLWGQGCCPWNWLNPLPMGGVLCAWGKLYVVGEPSVHG